MTEVIKLKDAQLILDGDSVVISGRRDDDEGPPVEPPIPGEFKKWNPGDYTRPQGNFCQQDQASYWASVKRQVNEHVISENASPHIKGAFIAAAWGHINPSLGVFHWDEVDEILEMLHAAGKRMMLMIPYKSFHKLPEPMLEAPSELRHQIDETRSGWWGGLHRPDTMTQFIGCMDIVAQRYDSHPALEMFITQESAPSFGRDDDHPNGYAPDDYKVPEYSVQLQRLYTELGKMFSQTIVSPSINSLSGEMGNLFNSCLNNGLGIAGPDAYEVPAWEFWMGRPANGETPDRAYENSMARPVTVSSPSLRRNPPAKCITMMQDDQGTTHRMWVTSENWGECKAAIAANPRINEACPINLPGCRT